MNRTLSIWGSFALLSIAGCGGGGNDDVIPAPEPPPSPAELSFEITVTNLTNAQPLSPVAVVAHGGGFRVFQLGEAASPGLEALAEGGDNSQFISEATSQSGVLTTQSGEAPIDPAGSETLRISVNENDAGGLMLSVATMLVNTNDAFTGINAISVSELLVDEFITRREIAYDAGTEADSEAAGTIPGPAVGGEGFNELRDDEADRVSMHPGVISNEDGLDTSVLSSQARFDNPVVEFRITRVE